MRPRKVSRHEMTVAQCERALEWFSLKFGLHSWDVVVYIDGEAPSWVTGPRGKAGACQGTHWCKEVEIWLNEEGLLRGDREDCLKTLFHELLHVALWEASADPCEDDSATCREEYFIENTSLVLAASYRAGVK